MYPQSLSVGPANSRAFDVYQRNTPVTARCTVLNFCQTPAQIRQKNFLGCFGMQLPRQCAFEGSLSPATFRSFLLETDQFCNHKTCGMQDVSVLFVSAFMF